MPSPQPQQQGSFSLFPSPNSSKPPLPRAVTGQEQEFRVDTPDHAQTQQAQTASRASPGHGRHTPQQRWHAHAPVQIQQPPQPQRRAEPPERAATPSGRTEAETAFSGANTLVRSGSGSGSGSGRSRSSIAKYPLGDDTLRSIFPTYDPDVPLGQQHYAPTQLSPARIPRAVISRQSVYEEQPESPRREGEEPASPPRPAAAAAAAARGRWPLRIQTQAPPSMPSPCSTADLKSLWRVANGWKASASEGRVFCLRLAQQKDAPVYTLSSGASYPLWSLRLDPTSASSAYVNLTRHDPSKPYKAPPKPPPPPRVSPPGGPPSASSSGRSSGTGSRSSDTKNWHEALTTTLEEESRKHPPNDGLVALLTPSAAARMAIERAGDAASVAAAENECARLVWDEDTATHYLVHNALAKPFCLTIERSPAYSRTEYTLEHDESPRHIARLTKDGTGGGWVELDTGVASQIASCYVLDVAVASLLLVAAAEDRNSPAPMETFEPPPPAFLGGSPPASGRLSKLSVRRDDDDKKKKEEKKKKKKKKKQRRMEEFEIDVESQDDSLGKGRRENRSPEDKLPLLIRAVVKLAEGLFSLVIWILTVLFMCVGGVFKVLYKCVGSKY
ncbi:hypothetical protein C2857_007754 [Epichloe festucae Fl1]|uniref:Acetylserotonin methytransferase-like protein n=1 Tax=Epichloe festucae (strain Fl1) TaxID=877507 RepID=A0A7S9PT18_EPIFF|nr:hypothetical protein C2857_007754 [Epichloe festucae Fl1]